MIRKTIFLLLLFSRDVSICNGESESYLRGESITESTNQDGGLATTTKNRPFDDVMTDAHNHPSRQLSWSGWWSSVTNLLAPHHHKDSSGSSGSSGSGGSGGSGSDGSSSRSDGGSSGGSSSGSGGSSSSATSGGSSGGTHWWSSGSNGGSSGGSGSGSGSGSGNGSGGSDDSVAQDDGDGSYSGWGDDDVATTGDDWNTVQDDENDLQEVTNNLSNETGSTVWGFIVAAILAGMVGVAFFVFKRDKDEDGLDHPLDGAVSKRIKLFTGVFNHDKSTLESNASPKPTVLEISEIEKSKDPEDPQVHSDYIEVDDGDLSDAPSLSSENMDESPVVQAGGLQTEYVNMSVEVPVDDDSIVPPPAPPSHPEIEQTGALQTGYVSMSEDSVVPPPPPVAAVARGRRRGTSPNPVRNQSSRSTSRSRGGSEKKRALTSGMMKRLRSLSPMRGR